MARNILKLAALALLATVGTANAGGFGRGTADTDILFEEGNFNLRAGATIVSPTRKYTRAFAPLGGSLVGHDYAETYTIPSAAVKLNINDDLRCAGTFTQSHGGSASWAVPYGTSAKLSEQFVVNELGATCGYKFDLSKGRVWLLGGVFMEMFDYDLVAGAGTINVALKSNELGWRIGAAYEIPEIALRTQLMYRSGTDHEATGTTNGFPIASGSGSLGQSVEFKAQSGVAPGWLVFGSVKWTDHSVTEQLILNLNPITTRTNDYFWKDGWTVSAGVGHAFNDKWSGALSVTWDQGVGTGWDLSSDTWTVGTGLSYKDDMGGELKFGGGLTYIAGATEDKYAGPLNSAVDSGWAWALGASYKTKW